MKIHIAFILLLTLSISQPSKAQFACGSINLFSKTTDWMREFNKTYSPFNLIGSEETQCGMQGEEFKVCKSCSTFLDKKQLNLFRTMLISEKNKSWMKRFKSELNDNLINLSLKDFETEKKMNHVRINETRDQFENRINDNWGETFFFFHRETYKMIQFELTFAGSPCLNPFTDFTNLIALIQPDFNISTNIKLNKIKTEINKLTNPNHLKKISLNELGLQMSEVTKHLYPLLIDSNETVIESTKHYWMLHAYTDSLIGQWLKANDYSEISTDCSFKKKCYQWKGTYTATYPL